MSEDTEVWVRYVTHAHQVPLEPWHLEATTTPRVPLTACGISLTEGDIEAHLGMPDIAPHGGEGGENMVRQCHLCYQIHLARLGVNISDDPISEDYEANSDTIRASSELPGSGVRWQQKTAFERIMAEGLRPFGPKAKDHPSHGNECPACFEPLLAGDYTTLVPLGPGRSPDDRQKAVAGKPYNSVAVEVHWSCATGLEDEVAETFIEYQEKVEAELESAEESADA